MASFQGAPPAGILRRGAPAAHDRRRRCAGLAWLLVFAATGVACPTMAQGEDWPRWRGPRGDGTWQAPPLPATWPAAGLPVVWKQAIGGGYAGVTVAGDTVLVMDRQQQPMEVERILAFDRATGRPLWTHQYPVAYGKLDYGTGPRAAPTVIAGRAYTLGAVGHVCCLELASGKLLWDLDSVGQLQAKIPEWGFAASPLVWRDLVIVHVGVPGGSFLALDRNSGKEVWRASNDPAGYATPLIAPRASGPQLIGWTPEHIVGIAPASGQLEWSIPYKVTYGVSIATPILRNDLVFVTGYWEGSKAIRLGRKASEATLAWEENENLRGLMSQPLERGGYVYSLDKRFGVTCFELATGKKLWDDDNRLTPRGRNPQATLVWLGDTQRVIALNAEGELVLARLTPAGYEEQSRAKIIGPTWAHPGYAGRQVFARDDQELVCVQLAPEEE